MPFASGRLPLSDSGDDDPQPWVAHFKKTGRRDTGCDGLSSMGPLEVADTRGGGGCLCSVQLGFPPVAERGCPPTPYCPVTNTPFRLRQAPSPRHAPSRPVTLRQACPPASRHRAHGVKDKNLPGPLSVSLEPKHWYKTNSTRGNLRGTLLPQLATESSINLNERYQL